MSDIHYIVITTSFSPQIPKNCPWSMNQLHQASSETAKQPCFFSATILFNTLVPLTAMHLRSGFAVSRTHLMTEPELQQHPHKSRKNDERPAWARGPQGFANDCQNWKVVTWIKKQTEMYGLQVVFQSWTKSCRVIVVEYDPDGDEFSWRLCARP